LLDTLPNLDIALVFAIVTPAYLIRGIAGFGSGLIAIPLLSLILPLQISVPLIVLLDYLASLGHGVSQRRAIRWSDIRYLIPSAVVGVSLAIYVFDAAGDRQLLKALGVFIILFALYSLLTKSQPPCITRAWALPAGFLGGFVGTLFGTGGPFYASYLRARQLDKASFRATFACLFLLDGATRLTGYSTSGLLTITTLGLLGLCLPAMIIALHLGGRIHARISQRQFQRGISILLLFSGSALLLK